MKKLKFKLYDKELELVRRIAAKVADIPEEINVEGIRYVENLDADEIYWEFKNGKHHNLVRGIGYLCDSEEMQYVVNDAVKEMERGFSAFMSLSLGWHNDGWVWRGDREEIE